MSASLQYSRDGYKTKATTAAMVLEPGLLELEEMNFTKQSDIIIFLAGQQYAKATQKQQARLQIGLYVLSDLKQRFITFVSLMDLIQYLIAPYKDYSIQFIVLESIAVVFGILSVFFSIRKNIWVYPTGIISTVLYVYILFQAGLVGDTLINFYYTIMSIYGWIAWHRVKVDAVHVQVTRASKKEWTWAAILFIFSIIAVSIIYYFKPLINGGELQIKDLNWQHLDWANYLDILTTSIFLVGMWFMARQKVENWLFWIMGDFICIPMMIYKSLGLTALQYLIFTLMAIKGYRDWKRSSKTIAQAMP